MKDLDLLNGEKSDFSNYDSAQVESYYGFDANISASDARRMRKKYLDSFGFKINVLGENITLFKIAEHNYIDGTKQKGLLIDDDGNFFGGDIINIKLEDVINPVMAAIPNLIPVPKNRGFIKNLEGRYFYFPPLSDFKMAQIKQLEDMETQRLAALEAQRLANTESQRLANIESQRLAAIEKKRLAGISDNQKRINEERKRIELQKSESEKKIAEQNRLAAQKTKDDSAQRLALVQQQDKAKIKKIAIISTAVLLIASGVGYFIWKRKN